MNKLNGSANKSAYQKPILVELNSTNTAGGSPMDVSEGGAGGTNTNRKMQSLGPPPS